MSYTCSSCSAVAPQGAAFCGSCGTTLEDPGTSTLPPAEVPTDTSIGADPVPGPTSVTINIPPALSRFHHYVASGNVATEAPLLLWLAIGLLGLAGLFVVIPALSALPDAFDLLGQGEFGRTFGLFLTVLLLLMISFGAACFYLAVKLLQADRAGRILTIILAGSLGFGLLLGDAKGSTEIMTILGCGGVIAILALIEEVTTFFTGPQAAQAEVATSVVAARSIVVALSWILGATGLAFLPLGGLAGRFVIVGIVLLSVAAVAFKFSGNLIPGDENARLVITGLMIAYVIAIFVLEPDGASLFIPIGLAISVIGLLWGPEDARRHFDSRSAVS